MHRELLTPRKNWQQSVENLGLLYHTPGVSYWDESACYRFSARQIDVLEKATEELHGMCLEAVQRVIDKELFPLLHIPDKAVPLIVQSWDQEHPALHGRFDLAYGGGDAAPKMLEFNADTPTSLLEAAVIQWYWLRDVKPKADQFNSIHEKLIAKWRDLNKYIDGVPLYFGHIEDLEDLMTVTYLRDTAEQAGIKTAGIHIDQIHWDPDRNSFTNAVGDRIHSMYKLYPWEWLVHEEFGPYLLDTYTQMQWIEPIWKMVLSNKGILAVLWDMFPGHPNLLPAKIGAVPAGCDEWCKKPLLSREGANVTLQTKGVTYETSGDYGEEGFVFQQAAKIPNCDGNFPVIGSWYILDQGPAGIGIREAYTPITGNLSRFIPHYFE